MLRYCVYIYSICPCVQTLQSQVSTPETVFKYFIVSRVAQALDVQDVNSESSRYKTWAHEGRKYLSLSLQGPPVSLGEVMTPLFVCGNKYKSMDTHRYHERGT